MAFNVALYLAPDTQTCLFLRSGIVIFAPASAVLILSNYQAVVFDIAMVHALADKQPRPHGHGNAPTEVAWSSMEMPRKCHGKWHPNTVGTLSKPVKLSVSGRHFARI